MIGESKHVNHAPTHVCPRCGEWWDVETGGYDTWLISRRDNEGGLAATVWTESARVPVCPLDTTTLDEFRIVDE